MVLLFNAEVGAVPGSNPAWIPSQFIPSATAHVILTSDGLYKNLKP